MELSRYKPAVLYDFLLAWRRGCPKNSHKDIQEASDIFQSMLQKTSQTQGAAPQIAQLLLKAKQKNFATDNKSLDAAIDQYNVLLTNGRQQPSFKSSPGRVGTVERAISLPSHAKASDIGTNKSLERDLVPGTALDRNGENERIVELKREVSDLRNRLSSIAGENVGKYQPRFVIPEGCIIVQFDEYRQLKEDCWNQQQRIKELLSRMNDNSGLKVNKSPQNLSIPEGYTVVQSDEYEQLQKDLRIQQETIEELRSRSSGNEDTSGSDGDTNKGNTKNNHGTLHAFVVPDGYTFVLADEYRQLQEDCRNQRESIEELTSRLSVIARNNLKEGNPNIPDLSDKNRPTKLAELFAGMYDDEWSEAFDAMRGGKEESEEEDSKVIEKLLKIVKDSYMFCGDYADRQLQTLAMHMKDVVTSKTMYRSPDPKSTAQRKETRSDTEQSSTSEGGLATVPDTQDQTATKSKPNSDNLKEKKEENAPQKKGESSPEEKMLKDTWHIALRFAKSFRKETAIIAISDIKEDFKTIYMKENKIYSLLPELSKYIERCVELMWLMAVQDRPMSLRWATKGEKSDTNFFKFFMSKGRYVKLCAWPAVFLCENGAIVSKGYIVGENPPPSKEDEKKTKKR